MMNYLSSENENESHLLNVIVSLQGQELKCDVNRNKSRNISEFKQIDAKINLQLSGKKIAILVVYLLNYYLRVKHKSLY